MSAYLPTRLLTALVAAARQVFGGALGELRSQIAEAESRANRLGYAHADASLRWGFGSE